MRSIPAAMVWEMLSRGRWSLIGTALASNLMPVMILSALYCEGAFEPADQSQITIHMILVQINLFVFAAGVFAAQGNAARLFAFPVSTPSLVLWRMMPTMVAVFLELLASTAAMNVAFDLDWPMWGPALFAAAAVAAMQATFWYCDKSTWIFWGYGFVALALGLWFRSRYGATFSRMGATHMWSEVSLFDGLTMLALTAISWYLALVGMTRNRSGGSLPSPGFLEWAEPRFDQVPESGQRFRTATQAQAWMEWQRKGAAMPVAFVYCLIIGLAGWVIFSRDPNDLFFGFVAGGVLLSVLGLVIGLVMGNTGPNDSDFEMGHFRATRPMSSCEMAQIILGTAAKSVVVVWLLWAAAFLLLYLTLQATNSFPQQALPEALTWWYFPATLIGSWIVVATLTSVGLTGRSSFFLQILFVVLTPFFGLLLLRASMLSQSHYRIEQGLVIAFGIGFVLGTARAFVVARRRSMIGSTAVWSAAGVFAVLCASIVFEFVRQPAASTAIFVFAVGLAALAVAPLATAPLAVAWNRNR